jgi:cytochrome o ubiquinol oxidase operon protein cyoD
MSSSLQHAAKAKEHEHGSMKSYVIGFLLSLIFTAIPYYLVVNQTVTGTVLMVTILSFAVLQMIIQITFFLHLGRGPKPKWNLFFFMSTVGIILFIVTASILIMNHLHYNMSPIDQTKKLVNDEAIYQIGGVKTGACQEIKVNHKVTISSEVANPFYTVADKCDTLTFINEDDEEISITFGTFPNAEAYAGERVIVVKKGVNETITLSESGTYQFRETLKETAAGHFTVK